MTAYPGLASIYSALEIANCGLPSTQEESCALGARVSLKVGPIPETDEQILWAASGLASGLFGEAFEAADEAQRAVWIDMCERALRIEMELTI